MTPEEKSLLERTYKISEENNKILHTIRRYHRISFLTKIAYWVIIIIISMGAYFLIQPFVEMISGFTTQFQDVLDIIPKK